MGGVGRIRRIFSVAVDAGCNFEFPSIFVSIVNSKN